jgi:hypothetical protein
MIGPDSKGRFTTENNHTFDFLLPFLASCLNDNRTKSSQISDFIESWRSVQDYSIQYHSGEPSFGHGYTDR